MGMANCLMLLSRGGEISMDAFSDSTTPSRVFECKTCNRQFQSFQALGGHRASHKKPRLTGGDDENLDSQSHGSPTKPKTHECSICGLEFAIGQALGGHMRRHRPTLSTTTDHIQKYQNQAPDFNLKQNLQQARPLGRANSNSHEVHIVKKTSTSRRVLFLDLNLTPFENDLEYLRLGKAAPMLDLVINY